MSLSQPFSPKLNAERHTLTTNTHGVELIAPVKKYTRTYGPIHGPNDPAVILFLGHGAGFFKEIWEPTIEALFSLDDEGSAGRLPAIREVWGLDCQNHGEACQLNENHLASNPGLVNIWDYADAIAKLFKSGLLGTLNDTIHKVVLCGHSAGSVGMTLATSWFNPPARLPFASLILIDPPIWTKAMTGKETEIYKLIEATTPIRRDIWKDVEAAEKWMMARPPYPAWDPRVFKIYLKHGLTKLPTAYYPGQLDGVTLLTHKMAENVAFTGVRYQFDALNRLNQICDYIPVHLIYGARNDMFDREVQDSLIDPVEGRSFASITRVKRAGHLVPLEAPKGVAVAIFNILKGKAGVVQASL